MRPPRRPSCSKSSFSSSYYSYSLAATDLKKRLVTIFKKAQELTTLCDIEACVIHYGPDGELKTWPEERHKVRDLALRYIQLDQAKRRKKSFDLYGFLNKNKEKMKNLFNKAKRNVEELKYPISDHYSPDQINQLTESLELSYSVLQERRRFLESQTNVEDHQHLQTQSSNPTKYSEDYSPLLQESGLKNHTLTQKELCGYDRNNNFQHLCLSNTEGYSAALPAVHESRLQNQLMHKELHGCYDQNMCLGNIYINNFTHPCVSNTQDNSVLQESGNNYGFNQLMQYELYGFDQNMCMSDINNKNVLDPDNSVLPSELQESGNNYGFDQLMQHELYGFDQNMCMSDINNSNVLDPCLSNRVSADFCFSQFFPDMSSSYFDENNLL